MPWGLGEQIGVVKVLAVCHWGRNVRFCMYEVLKKGRMTMSDEPSFSMLLALISDVFFGSPQQNVFDIHFALMTRFTDVSIATQNVCLVSPPQGK